MYLFGSEYWNSFFDYAMLLSSVVCLAIAGQIIMHKHL